MAQTPAYRAWTGYAFESLCLRHARELTVALDIDRFVKVTLFERHSRTRKRIDGEALFR